METTSAGVPEINSPGVAIQLPPAPEGSFSGRREDFARDMALIAKEMGVSEPQTAPMAEPAPEIELTPLTIETPQEPKQPEQPKATAPVIAEQPKVEAPQVPDKFKTPDGKVDESKLLKSFLEAEKALKREQNKNRQALPPAPAVPAPQNPQAVPVQNEAAPNQYADPFVNQVENDIRTIGLAATLVKLAEAQHQATVKETIGRVQSIEELAQEQAMTAELKAIAKRSPEIFTPQGLEELKRVRAENPEIKSWTKAYVHYLGEKQFNAAGDNPVMPSPKANTAPMVPVSAGNRFAATNTGNVPVAGADLERMLANMTPEQENEFWKRNVPGARPVNRIARK